MGESYTVLLKCPNYANADDNGYCGTWQGHVFAEDPETAIDEAVIIAADDMDLAYGHPEDWGFVAVFAGHLNNLYTP